MDTPILVQPRLAFGAGGYVARAMTADHLLEGIAAALDGGIYIPSDMPVDGGGVQLTGRQWEILGMVCMGLTNKEIARRLDLSISTVKFHVGLILETLRVQNRQQAISACCPV